MKNRMFKRVLSLVLAMVMVLSLAPMPHAHAHSHSAPNAGSALPEYELMTDTLEQKLTKLEGYDPDEIVSFILELEGKSLLDSKPASASTKMYLATADAEVKRIEKEQKTAVTALAKMADVEVTHSYRVILNGFAVKAPRSAMAELKAIPGVKAVYESSTYDYVEPVNGYVPAEFTSGDMIDSDRANAEGYTGKGTLTAILDTGLDTNHEAFQADPAGATFTKEDVAELVAAGGLLAGTDVDSLYKSAKVPFAYDYADYDYEVLGSNDHGTHVAGSVGANGTHLSGVAPDTQLAILKVFSDTQNGAASEWIYAALEDAVVLGVDTINMSLGSAGGFSTDSADDAVYNKVKAAGINLMVSAGNDTDANYGTNLGTNLALISEPDNGIVGSPSTLAAAMSVASVNEEAIFQTYILAGDRHIVFSDTNDGDMGFINALDGQTLEYVYVPGFGTEADFANVDVTGKIALVPRGGEVAFTTKEENAKNAGAVALIVYNNEDNAALINMQLNGLLPAIFISKEDGNFLRKDHAEKTISVSADYRESIVDDTCGLMSDFSSLGVTPDLKLKPEITAPGGNVYSTLPGNKYGLMSGTSMASPHMAGAASVVRQYVNETFPDMTDLEKQAYINNVIMNTAVPVLDEYGVAYTPRKQGAGLAQIYNAIHTGAYVTVDGSERPKADLGDSANGDFTKEFTLTLHNTSAADLSYAVSALPLTAEQTTAVGYDGNTYDVISNYARIMPDSELEVTFSAETVTVPAGGTASVTVKLHLTEEGKTALADFVNGTFLDGFVQLTALDEDGIDLGVPYLGFYGDWGKAEVFDDTVYDEEMASAYPSAMALFSIYSGTGFYLGTNLFAGEDSELFDVYDADKIAYASRDAYYGRNNYYMLFSILGLLRSPEKLTYTITDSTGAEIYRNEVDHEVKSFLTSSGYINYAMGPDPSSGWDPLIPEEDGSLWWAPDGDYTLTIDAQVAGTDTVQTTSFPFSIDNDLPKVTETRYYVAEDGTPYIDVSVTDNNYVMSIQLISADGTEALAAAEVIGEEQRGAVTTFTYDLTEIQAAGYKTGRIAMYDYALNYNESDLFSLVSEFIEADTVTIINQGMTASGTSSPFVIEAMIEPANAKDKTLVWESSNPEVASVEALGTTRYDQYADVTYYQALLTPHNVTGDATITATATNGVSGSTTIHVTGTEPEEPGLHKVLHLDNGRKLYSKEFIIALLNEMSAAGYTELQLAVGNDGLRFVLDDMTITTAAKTYASADVLAAIEVGNKAYHDEGEKNALTQSEMDEIIAHADSVGIQIVAHVNMTAHMNAALDAMVELGITDAHFTGWNKSDRSLNLNSDEAVAFTKELLKLYVNYFSEKGCDYFHIGSDEFGNDAYGGNMGFGMMGSSLYAKYNAVINDCAQIVKDAGMTPRAWNDGVSYRDYTSSFDTDMEITYWSSGWWGYNVAAASTLEANGHGMLNTHGDYYYVLGKDDKFTPDKTTEHDPNLYTECAGYELNKFMGSDVQNPIGGMFCIWGDVPDAETETEVAKNIRLILRAMAKRMDGESIEGLDTSVVEGGFNEDGTINGAEPHEHAFGDWVTTTEPTCTEEGVETRTCECGETETRTVAALGHDYVAVVTPPTETEQGYTTHTCSRCGDSYVDSYTDPLPPAGEAKPIPEDFVIREDGRYNIPADLNQKVLITDNARDVELVFNATKDAPHSNLYFVSEITEGLHLTIENANAHMGTTYDNKVSFLDFQGKGNTLTLVGESNLSSLDNSYMSKALIRVAVGTELTIDGEGTLNMDQGGLNPAAAIGSNSGENAGTIVINGGNLNIVNKGSGAAIGGASSRTAEKLVVNGGNLNLTCEFYQGDYSNNISNNGAGIGTGNYVSGYDYVSGTQNKPPVIEINGGTITGVTNTGAPIIGTCASSSIGTNITINCGKLNLTSNASGSATDAGACIGTARSVSGTPSITINGGEIYAVTNSYAAAIGSGPNSKAGTVYIYGGTVTAISTNTAQAVAAIGPGYYGTAGSLWISGGSVKATSASTTGIVTASAVTNDDLDAVYENVIAAPGVTSVTVDGRDWKVSANHPDDDNIYLWLTEGDHDIVIEPAPAVHEHSFGEWVVTTEPTCTETGVQIRTCACGETETEVIPALGHTFGEWTVTTEPTCTAEGAKTRTCATCGETETETLPALGHTGEVLPGKDATCTEEGLTEGKKCAVCGEILVAQEVIPALGHTFGEWTVTTEPTCTAEGAKTRTCATCGETETEAIPALGHTEEVLPGKPATCTEEGLTEGKKCAVCGEILVAQEVIPMREHTFGDWEEKKPATCTEDGYIARSCSVCKFEERKTLPAFGHSFGQWYTVQEPTCTEEGIEERQCAGWMYGCYHKEQRPIPATGHTFGDWVTIKEPTCTADGEIARYCHCGEVETLAIPAIECPGAHYVDNPVGDWYHDAVDYVTAHGYMNGMDATHFGPALTMNRAQFVTVLYRMAGSPEVAYDGRFTDIPVGGTADWYIPAVAWAVETGITTGATETTFNPEGKLTRTELVVFLYRYAKACGYDTSASADLSAYRDSGLVLDFAVEAWSWAVATGIVTGMTADTLAPMKLTNRAQAATFFQRFDKAMAQ